MTRPSPRPHRLLRLPLGVLLAVLLAPPAWAGPPTGQDPSHPALGDSGNRQRRRPNRRRRRGPRARREAERRAAEEAARIEAERAEAARIEAERLEAERVEAERLAQEERLAAEAAETESAANRAAIIEQLRCTADDEFCFGGDVESTLEASTHDSTRSIDELLEAVLARTQAQEALIEAGRQEMADEDAAQDEFVTQTEHVAGPPSDFYTEPAASIARMETLDLDRIDPTRFDLPIALNERVRSWLDYFLGRGRGTIVRWLARREHVGPYIQGQLREAGLPEDLLYLAMIESGFSPTATSWASAAGVWQFMPRTGDHFGLTRDWWRDDRRDIEQSTRAAIEYLTYLHEFFDGDWLLACAGYNAGQGRVRRALQQTGTSDYWELSETEVLAMETRQYVPKMLAAAIIGHYAEEYGLLDEIRPEHRQAPLRFASVEVPDSADLAVLAELLEVEQEQLAALNPQLRRGYTPPGSYRLRVPQGAEGGFAAAWASLPEERRIQVARYRIQRGDTLGRIASAHGVSVSELSRVNGITDPNRISIGMELMIPGQAAPIVTGDAIASSESQPTAGEAESADPTEGNQGAAPTGEDRASDDHTNDDALASDDQTGDALASDAGDALPSEDLTNEDDQTGEDDPSRALADSVNATGSSEERLAGQFAPSADDADSTQQSADALADLELDLERDAPPEPSPELDEAARAELAAAAAAVLRGEDPSGDDPTALRPGSGTRPRTHIVTRGDSREALEESYDTTWERIAQVNRLDSETLIIGQRLTIPVAGPARSESAAGHDERAPSPALAALVAELGLEATDPSPSSSDSHNQESPDTDAALARVEEPISRPSDSATEEVRPARIEEPAPRIAPEQRLAARSEPEVERPSSASSTHEVAAGDTLGAIARLYEVTVSELQRLNRLTGDTIRIGQQLLLPATASIATAVRAPASEPDPGERRSYTVERGDSLSRIAHRNGVSVDDLVRWNQLRGDTVYIGQELVIWVRP